MEGNELRGRLIPILMPLLICLGGLLASASGEPAPASLDLPGAVREALVHDPQVLACQAELDRAKARVLEEMARLAPGCTIAVYYGDGSFTPVEYTAQSTVVTFTLSQKKPGLLPRIIGGRVVSAVERALWDQGDAEARLAGARVSAAAAAIQGYLDAAMADRALELSRGALALAEEDVRLARACLEAGTVTGLDVARAESNRDRAALEVRQAELDRRLAWDNLLMQTGRPQGLEVRLAPLPAALGSVGGEQAALAAVALKERAEAIAARTALRKAENALAECRNASLPGIRFSASQHEGALTLTITLDLTTGEVGWSLGGQWQQTTPVLPDPDDDGTSLGLTFVWTPFDGGVARALTAQAEAALAGAKAACARTEDSIRLEIARRLGALEMAELRLAQARREEELAARTRELAALRYQAGLALFSELGQATQALAQARYETVRAEYGLCLARVFLDAACGRMPPGVALQD